MSGIDRLRTLAGAWDEWGLGGTLAEMADEIERERAEDCYRMGLDCGTVWRVVNDMERHCLGHEGADDSPVARWARELRDALKSDTSDERGAQKPSWHDHAEAADVTSDAPKVTRDPAEDVSMSAYDLLPADERDAIAWVREHGGLDSVKKLLDWVIGHCSTKQQLDFDFWLSGRVMYELGFGEDMADREEVERRLLARLMPEGMEWPRYESDEVTVTVHDEDGDFDRTFAIRSIEYKESSVLLEGTKNEMVMLSYGERVVSQIDRGEHPLITYIGEDGLTHEITPDGLTHTKPAIDSWERIEKDARLKPLEYTDRYRVGRFGFESEDMRADLVRRCRALAERERGE